MLVASCGVGRSAPKSWLRRVWDTSKTLEATAAAAGVEVAGGLGGPMFFFGGGGVCPCDRLVFVSSGGIWGMKRTVLQVRQLRGPGG